MRDWIIRFPNIRPTSTRPGCRIRQRIAKRYLSQQQGEPPGETTAKPSHDN
jgi:hypothetical protein